MIKAEKLKTYDPKYFRAGYMSVKRNGVHGIFDPEMDMVYSRTPKEINGLQRLRTQLRHVPYPLVGELTIPDVDFETASGRIRSYNSTPEVVFNIFNSIVPGVKFKDRYDDLWTLKRKYFSDSSLIKIEPMLFVDSIQSFDRYYDSHIAQGEEGVCWISANHVYQPGKRMWSWMKRVPLKSIEAKVIAILKGTPGKKYENSMGRMLCEFKDSEGKRQEFGVGIFKDKTDAWRQDIYNNAEKYIDELITIEFKDYSKYGIPTQPRFKGFRWDL